MAHHVKNPERFHLRLHRELKEQAPYALVIGKNGARLKFSEDQSDEEATRSVGFGGFGLDATRKSLADLAGILMAWTDRPVVDMTGLTGLYDLRLDWSSSEPKQAGVLNQSDVMSSLQPLGLKLEPRKLRIEHLIVEHAEKVPVGN